MCWKSLVKYDVVKKHIELYVNDYSLELGQTGQQAVTLFFEKAGRETDDLFVDL